MTRTRRPLRLEFLEDRTTPAAGDLDPTFGVGGKVSAPIGSDNAPVRVLVESDGRFVLAGDDARFQPSVQRRNADGSLDAAFGTGGTATFSYGGASTFVFDAVEQADGKVVLASSYFVGGLDGTIVAKVTRLTAAGQLDTTFGFGGTAEIAVPNRQVVPIALALQSDGKIVVVGTSSSSTGQPAAAPFVARLTADGQLDGTFGIAGVVVLPFAGSPTAVAAQADGGVLAAGIDGTTGLGNVFVTRLTTAGALDPTFAAGGTRTVDFRLAPTDQPNEGNVRLALQADGEVVVAGTADNRFEVARLNADGSTDAAFGTGGVARVGSALPAQLAGVAVQPSGDIVLGGNVDQGQSDLVVFRLRPNGTVDNGYADGRDPRIDFGGVEVARALVVRPDGGVVLAGYSNPTPAPGAQTFVAVRLLGDPPQAPAGSVLVGGPPDGTATVYGPAFQTVLTVPFFPGFSGTVHTATADVTGDGVPDYVGGAGPGGGPHVRVFDGRTGGLVGEVYAFEAGFTGGVFVAAADVTGDGRADLIVTPDRGGGPVVAVYDGARLTPRPDNGGAAAQLARFFGIDDPAFRGGARAAAGDLTGDGAADLVVSAGFLGGPRVAVYDGKSTLTGTPVKLVPDFFAFESTLRNGAFVSLGDVTGDGRADLAFGGGPGGGPRVRVFDGAAFLAARSGGAADETAGQVANFFAGDATLRGGVHVALRDVDGDGKADLLAGSGDGEPARLRTYQAATVLAGSAGPDEQTDLFGGAALATGVFVG